MKKYFVLSLLVLVCSQSFAANTTTPANNEQTQGNWQPAVNMGGISPQAPATSTPPSAESSASNASTANQNAQEANQNTQPRNTNSPDTTTSSNDSLPPPSPIYQAAQQQVSPLSPDEIRTLRGQSEQNKRAMSSPTQTIVPRISAQTVDLSPGSSLPLVRAAVNYTSNVSFTDATGAPWPLAAPALSANSNDFAVYSIPNGPIITLRANRAYATGSVTVYLKGLSVPIVLTVSSGDTDSRKNVWTVDSRLDLRIPRRGPQAAPMAEPESKIGLYDDVLQAFLDGTPPQGAQRLKVSGGVPETTVWQMGDDLYIRSRADLMDEFDQTLSSADGMHLWKMPVTPYATFSVMGHAVPLNITLE